MGGRFGPEYSATSKETGPSELNAYKYSLIDLVLTLNDLPDWLQHMAELEVTTLPFFSDIFGNKKTQKGEWVIRTDSSQGLIRALSNSIKHYVDKDVVPCISTIFIKPTDGKYTIGFSFGIEKGGVTYDLEALCDQLLEYWEKVVLRFPAVREALVKHTRSVLHQTGPAPAHDS